MKIYNYAKMTFIVDDIVILTCFYLQNQSIWHKTSDGIRIDV